MNERKEKRRPRHRSRVVNEHVEVPVPSRDGAHARLHGSFVGDVQRQQRLLLCSLVLSVRRAQGRVVVFVGVGVDSWSLRGCLRAGAGASWALWAPPFAGGAAR